MAWLARENWVWLLVAAVLGAGITLSLTLRKVRVPSGASPTGSPADEAAAPVAEDPPTAEEPPAPVVGGAHRADVPKDEPASDGPGGPWPGSALPHADGTQPEGHAVKGNEGSMLFHTAESPYYARTRADIWFDTEDHARAAGFTRWDDR